jgi:hypothetical protein
LCDEISNLIPKDISFGSDPAYEDRCRALNDWPAPGLDDTDLSESGLPLELHRA